MTTVAKKSYQPIYRASVPPCSDCGTPGGFVRSGRLLPDRCDGTKYGGRPGVCRGCYQVLKRRTYARSAPSTAVVPALAARIVAWEPRRDALLAEIRARGAGYEADDRDPLCGPFRAVPGEHSSPRTVPDRQAVRAMRYAWKAGNTPRLWKIVLSA